MRIPKLIQCKYNDYYCLVKLVINNKDIFRFRAYINQQLSWLLNFNTLFTPAAHNPVLTLFFFRITNLPTHAIDGICEF